MAEMGRNGIWPLNLSTTITKLDAFIPQMDKGIKERVKTMVEEIFDDSQHVSPSCPIDTGRLISTGRVEQAEGGWAVVYGGEAFDGTTVDYANQVHDDLRPRRYSVPGSGPKFVEVHYLRHTDVGEDELIQTVMDLVGNTFI